MPRGQWLLIGFGLWVSVATAGEPALSETVDPQGHRARVWKVLFLKDGSGLITASEDKTIRLWDLARGTVRQTLRLPGRGGREGRAYAADLSPDGKTLAVGGYGLGGGLHFVHLISLEKCEILHSLSGHTDVIDAVSFSPDGKRLLSASHDRTARLWDLETRQTLHVLKGHTAEVASIAFAPDGTRAATGSFDTTSRLWDLVSGKRLAVLPGHAAAVRCTVWSSDGQTIATGSEDGAIRLWTSAGMLLRTFDSLGQRTITSLTFARDGRLLATQGDGNGPRTCGLVDTRNGQWAVKAPEPGGIVLDGAISPDGNLAATCGGDRHETVVWRTGTGQPVQTLEALGHRIGAVGWSGEGTQIAWGSATLEKRFDLNSLTIVDQNASVQNDTSHSWSRDDTRRLKSESSAIEIQRLGTVPLRIELTVEGTPDRLTCAALLPNDRVAIATESGLFVYDTTTGQHLRRLTGHAGRVLALCPSPDGKRLLSGGDDRTVRIWSPDRESPLFTLFPAGDEWAVWTPEGAFAASAGGEQLGGWRMDNGLNRLAGFVPFAHVHKGLFRPDVLRLVMKEGTADRAADLPAGLPPALQKALPPSVQITSIERREGATREVVLETLAEIQGDSPIVALQVLVNGRPWRGRAGRLEFDRPAARVRQDLIVPLTPGLSHELVVLAETACGYGLSPAVVVDEKPADDPPDRPALNLIAIGVSADETPRLKRAGATEDAREVLLALEAAGLRTYGRISSEVFVGPRTTRAAILGALNGLRKQMTPRDTAVVYFAGLALKDESGSCYLLPSDADPLNPVISAVPDTLIRSILQAVPGRVILLLDAPLSTAPNAPAGPALEDLVRDLAQADVGVISLGFDSATALRPSPFAAAVIKSLKPSPDSTSPTPVDLAKRIRANLAAEDLKLSVGLPALTPATPLFKHGDP